VGKTYDLLRRAETNFQKRSKQKKNFNDLERFLCKLGLDEEQISNQNQNEIRQSLILINRYIEKPDCFLSLISGDDDKSEIDVCNTIMAVLLDRKKLALLRYDALINREKFEKIKQVAGKIADKDIRSTIEKNLCQLIVKDQIFKKEYRKLDKM